jgi:hypothetical protein
MQPRLLPWAAATNFIIIGTTGERVVMSHVLENGHESVAGLVLQVGQDRRGNTAPIAVALPTAA